MKTFAVAKVMTRLGVPRRSLRQMAELLMLPGAGNLTLPQVVGLMVVTVIADDDGFVDAASARLCFDAVVARLTACPDGRDQVVRVELDQVFVGDIEAIEDATSGWRRGRAHEVSLDNFVSGALADLA